MSAGHVDFFCEAPRAALRLPGMAVQLRVLFLDARHERTRLWPGDIMMREGFRPDSYDLIVLRGSREFIQVVEVDPALNQHFRDARVVVIQMADEPMREPRVSTPGWCNLEPGPVSVALLREIETWGLMCARRALLGDKRQHFEIVSGSHLGNYLRVRDAFADVIDVDRLSDWIVPHVRQDTVLLGDRPALIPLLQAVALTVQRRFDWRLAFATLDPWPRRERSSGQTIDELLRTGSSDLLAVLAVDSLGRHEQELSMLGPSEFRAVTLVDVSSDEPLSGLPFHHEPIPRWVVGRSGECEQCREELPLVLIDPRTEDLTPATRRKAKKLTFSSVEKDAHFWRAADRAKAVRVHADTAYDDGQRRFARHRAVDLDVTALLSDPEFRTACLELCQTLPSPDLVLVPDHEATQALISLVRDAHSIEDSKILTIPRMEIDQRVETKIESATSVLLLDDALVTGRTLRGLAENLRVGLGRAWESKDVRAFVPLSCPSRGHDRIRVENALRRAGDRSKRLVFAHEALLPATSLCAHCDERRWLESIADALPTHADVIDERLAELGQPIAPSTVLLRGGHDTAVVNDSVLAPKASVAATTGYAAFVSAAQRLRDEISAGDGLPQHYVDLAHAIEAWFDGPLIAGILRTLGEEEMSYARQSTRVADVVRAKDAHAAELCEIAWSAVRDKIPHGVIPALRERLSAVAEDDPVVRFLEDALAMRQQVPRPAKA
jgi:hypothetical protein